MKITVDDIIVLRNLIQGGSEAWLGVSLCADVIHIAQLKIQVELLSDTELNKLINDWLKEEFKGKYPKIYNFLFNVEYRKVPLYINDKELDLFVKWRLKIAK